MKKVFALLAVLIVTGQAKAWEFKDNPDRFPSIGVNLGGSAETGTAKTLASGSTYSQDVTSSSGYLVADLRLPVSNYVTIQGSIGSLSNRFDANETYILTGQKGDSSGATFNVGVRWYIH